MFKGVFTAIVTPFADGKIDEASLKKLVNWQIEQGIHGLIPCGTTGEGVTLNDEEWEDVVSIVLKAASGRVPVLAGAGSNSTDKAVKATKRAYKLGVDGVLQVTPYYNKPPQEGLYQHFKAVAEAADIPVMLYNVPGRTAVNMLPETVARLSKIKNIVALKEACGNLDQVKKVISLVPEKFSVLCGEDAQNFATYELGVVGAVSVASNVMPANVSDVWNKFENGDLNGARLAQEELQPLNKILFVETNPIPAKTSLSLMGFVRDEFRLPLVQMSNEGKQKLVEVLKGYKLIS